MRRLFLIAALFLWTPAGAQNDDATPRKIEKETFVYAVRDADTLRLDRYALLSPDSRAKPCLMFLFGGGFMTGTRDNRRFRPFFDYYARKGFVVVSIDYRLGMRGVRTKGGIGSVKQFYHSVSIASEDLFSATKYIIDNAKTLKVNPDNLVICGSSAGAMTVLETEWMLCNGKATEALPEGFRYAGVMSFSGAILSREGMPKYSQTPAPTAFFHGTADKVVNYGNIRVFNWVFAGTDKLVKIFKKNGYVYNAFRFKDHKHEIADSMVETFADQIRFLETNVTRKVARTVDSTIDDPEAPVPSGSANRKEMYGK